MARTTKNTSKSGPKSGRKSVGQAPKPVDETGDGRDERAGDMDAPASPDPSPPIPEEPKPEPEPAKKQFRPAEVTIKVPLAEPDPHSYIAKQIGHLDVRLRGGERQAMRRLHAGLIATGAKLPDGRPVASTADVIRWLAGEVVSGY